MDLGASDRLDPRTDRHLLKLGPVTNRDWTDCLESAQRPAYQPAASRELITIITRPDQAHRCWSRLGQACSSGRRLDTAGPQQGPYPCIRDQTTATNPGDRLGASSPSILVPGRALLLRRTDIADGLEDGMAWHSLDVQE